MSHPLKGQSLSTFYFKENEKEEVFYFLNKINSVLTSSGMDAVPCEDPEVNLKKCFADSLSQILSLNSLNTEMGLVSPKAELSKEFLQIKEMMVLVPDLLRRVNTLKQKIEIDLKSKSSNLIEEILRNANNAAFTYSKERKQTLIKASEDALNFANFKEVIDEVMGIHSRVGDLLLYEKNYTQEISETFKIIKQKTLMKKVKINEIVQKVNSNIVSVEQLKEIDPLAYEYLRTEAFQKFCNDLSIKIGERNVFSGMAKPSEALGKTFKLLPQEILIFSTSLEPIKNFNTQIGQVVKSKSLFGDFFVASDQVTIKHEVKMFYENVDQPIQLLIPVYFSYVRANMNAPQKIQKNF